MLNTTLLGERIRAPSIEIGLTFAGTEPAEHPTLASNTGAWPQARPSQSPVANSVVGD